MKLRLIAAALSMSLCLGWMPSAAADEWQLVLSDRDRRVEIDRASIFNSDRGTKVSWGRVVLSPEEARKSGYATIRALNRYDCANRSFFTIKRVYLDSAGRVIREEAVTDTSPVLVARNSVDERMWREVCRPPTVSDLEKVAAAAEAKAKPVAAAKPPARAEAKPSVAPGSAATPAARPAKPAPSAAPAVRAADYKPADAAGAPARDKVAETRATPSGDATPAASPMPPQRPLPPAAVADASPHAPAPATRPESPMAAQAAAASTAGASRTAAPRPSTAASPASRITVGPAEPRWSYEGDTGPEHWARLRPDWKLCGEGTRQSPVDLRDGVAVDLEPVKFDYRTTRFRITDTGNTLQVSVGDGMGIEVRGRRYELTDFTLHRPSEERVGGRAADMSVHFHHRDLDGRQAVVAVMLERGDQSSALLQTLWNNLPLEKSGYMPAATIDLGAFLPASPAHFLYMGSQTTPPCTEGVLWVVMKAPVPVSDEQLGIFARLYPRNSRPIQPANGRLILESR